MTIQVPIRWDKSVKSTLSTHKINIFKEITFEATKIKDGAKYGINNYNICIWHIIMYENLKLFSKKILSANSEICNANSYGGEEI